MSRISTYASNTVLINDIMDTVKRVQDRQLQVASEKVSTVYSGVTKGPERLIQMENTVSSLEGFKLANNIQKIRLDIAQEAVTGVTKLARTFRGTLQSFQTLLSRDKNQIENVQKTAFESLRSLQSLLNSPADGRYVFGGARVSAPPVDMKLTTLADFQSKYNGSTVTTPTTRAMHLDNFNISKSSTGVTNWLTFERLPAGGNGRSRITDSSGQFDNVTVGTTITISGAGASNNGTYTVAAVDTTNNWIEIKTDIITTEAAVASNVTYPDFDSSTVGATKAINNASLTFTAPNTIAHGGALNAIPVGSSFTISGTASNNGTFTVKTNSGGNITIEGKYLTDEGTVAAPYFSLAAVANVTFTNNASPTKDTIASTTLNAFSSLKAGMKVVVSGGTTQDGTYTIDSVSADNQTLTIVENLPAATVNPASVTLRVQTAPGTVAATPYYKGDFVTTTHRPDSAQTLDLDINAADPAFEKVARAMMLIAQGAYGTEGGLDQNLTRVTQAIALLSNTLDSASSTSTPFGAEATSNLQFVAGTIGYQASLLDATNKTNDNLIGFLQTGITDIENVDQTETIARLLDEVRALEAAYKSVARIREISLVNFL